MQFIFYFEIFLIKRKIISWFVMLYVDSYVQWKSYKYNFSIKWNSLVYLVLATLPCQIMFILAIIEIN